MFWMVADYTYRYSSGHSIPKSASHDWIRDWMPIIISAGDGHLPLLIHLMIILYCCSRTKGEEQETAYMQPSSIKLEVVLNWIFYFLWLTHWLVLSDKHNKIQAWWCHCFTVVSFLKCVSANRWSWNAYTMILYLRLKCFFSGGALLWVCWNHTIGTYIYDMETSVLKDSCRRYVFTYIIHVLSKLLP